MSTIPPSADSDATLPPRSATDTHDFAPYIRILGRGPGRSRSLTRAEARHALGMVLRGEATSEQIGAMLMLLRYRGEAAEEMAGLVEAARAHAGLPLPYASQVDLDWPSYADGRTRGLPWYLLSALLLAQSGIRVVMHGPLAGPGRQPLVECLGLLGMTPAEPRNGFTFLPLESVSPGLARLLALRGVLGLRSPLNTVGRLLNPSGAKASVDGVFHPAYIALHLTTAALLGSRIAVMKGGGGEAEWSGAKPLSLRTADGETVWPALATTGKPDSQSPTDLLEVWSGGRDDPAAETAIIATAAVALYAMGKAGDPPSAIAHAAALWSHRNAPSSGTGGC